MLVLLTGGSASGKSTYGMALLGERAAPRMLISTMDDDSADAVARIARQREECAARGVAFVQRFTGIGAPGDVTRDATGEGGAADGICGGASAASGASGGDAVGGAPGKGGASGGDAVGGAVLLDCLCNLLANEMFDASGRFDPGAEARVLAGVEALASRCADLIVVTNEVGSGYAPELSVSSRRYMEALGRLGQALARRADRVVELVCGIPVTLKPAATTSKEGSA